MRLDLDRIRAARQLIDPVFLDTPLYRFEALDRVLGCAVSIKLETANPVRCFKGRGTEVVAAGAGQAVVCASAGNLGQALAWSGRRRGRRCRRGRGTASAVHHAVRRQRRAHAGRDRAPIAR